MKAAVIAIVVTVVAALLSAYLTDWFSIGDDPPDPPDRVAVPRVVALNHYGRNIGGAPYATIEVDNQGTATAENCIIHWTPGFNVRLGSVDIVAKELSGAFGLQPGETLAFTLQSKNSFSVVGWYDSTAWIVCSNATSESVVARVLVVG